MTLTEYLDRITDQASFYVFVAALIADREQEVDIEKRTPSSPYGPGANGWENLTIEAYLEAALAWAQDSGANGLPSSITWQAFATFLYCGKIYE